MRSQDRTWQGAASATPAYNEEVEALRAALAKAHNDLLQAQDNDEVGWNGKRD